MTRFSVFTVSSGSSIVLGAFNGGGNPRLFEGSSIYIYRLAGSLLRSSDLGSTWDEIGNGSTPLAVCQDVSQTTAKTVVFTYGTSGSYQVIYQAITEITSGWTASGSLPASFYPVDAVADSATVVGILVANGHGGTEPRVVRGAQQLPYSFSQSDSGLPAQKVLTDLELVVK